jgi:uncharacterized protein (DUF1810 family)
MVEDEFEHFLDAQEPIYGEVLKELSAGQKQSHWMWFIFPQIQGLGHSPMAQKFALESLEQARRYVQHIELGQRLRQCTQLVLQINGRPVSEIFGFPDDLKFHSSMTSFALAVPNDPIFKSTLEKYFGGKLDGKTVAIVGAVK